MASSLPLLPSSDTTKVAKSTQGSSSACETEHNWKTHIDHNISKGLEVIWTADYSTVKECRLWQNRGHARGNWLAKSNCWISIWLAEINSAKIILLNLLWPYHARFVWSPSFWNWFTLYCSKQITKELKMISIKLSILTQAAFLHWTCVYHTNSAMWRDVLPLLCKNGDSNKWCWGRCSALC